MPRTKTGEFNQIAYQNEFNKRNYDRIEIKVPKGKKSSNSSGGNGSRAERKRIYQPGH